VKVDVEADSYVVVVDIEGGMDVVFKKAQEDVEVEAIFIEGVDRECETDELDVEADIDVELVVSFVLEDVEQVSVDGDVGANVKVIVIVFVYVKVGVIVVWREWSKLRGWY
jgi:hypothetical protein